MLVKRIGEYIFTIGLGLCFLGLFFADYFKLTSLATLLIGLSLFVNPKVLLKIPLKFIIIILIPLFFVITDFIRAGVTSDNINKFLLMLGFVLIACASLAYKKVLLKFQKEWLYTFAFIVLIVNIISVSNYFLNREEYDILLSQSKSIPIFGGMHHIHFGILNAIIIAVLGYFELIIQDRKEKLIVAILLLLFLISFHVLSSRTGMLSFYAALMITFSLFAIRFRKLKVAVIGISVIIVANLLAISFSSSFRSKIANTVEDVNSWGNDDQINYKSMAMRIEAYKVCVSILKDHPFIGVGNTSMDAKMQLKYKDMQSPLYIENRVGPHNQYLEYAIKYGITGFLFVGIFFALWCMHAWNTANYLLLFITGILLFSCVFESLLERQVGSFLVAFFLPLGLTWGKD